MRLAPKTATTTAPNAAESQSFPDNLVADLGRVAAGDASMTASGTEGDVSAQLANFRFEIGDVTLANETDRRNKRG